MVIEIPSIRIRSKGKIIIIVSEKPVVSELNFYGVEAFQDDKLKIGLAL